MFVFFLNFYINGVIFFWNLLLNNVSFIYVDIYSSYQLIFNCPMVFRCTHLSQCIYPVSGEFRILCVCACTLCHEYSCTCVRTSAGYRPIREIDELCASSFILYHLFQSGARLHSHHHCLNLLCSVFLLYWFLLDLYIFCRSDRVKRCHVVFNSYYFCNWASFSCTYQTSVFFSLNLRL